jgi:cilia- and flagella-associated protein 52
VDGSEDSEINTLAISKDGDVFVSAGNDKQVKLWGYDDAQCYRVGTGHSGAVTKVEFL